ncbi:MAG: GFA family protein [Paludibacterium sp.]|uniref:GFA family protein n=1 Tax=Paludibacterium sp. TaxID=1917523 RepID=UPI0025F31911|nr:GFA family protein [Paludibacterium sp.]MBV8046970.1 GFA family protein [Paludibacterium sp.]MBV8648102.1 GFA family protein [Paludibacterium sp.]
MIVGGCLCGGVRYQYDGEIEEISLCHCSMCRKAQGSAYVAVSPIEAGRFRILRGQALLKAYRAVPEKARVFCSECGSPIYSANDRLPGVIRLRLGTVETPFTCANAYHAFVDSKAEWDLIADGLPQYAERRPLNQETK